jgi:outer membrane biosynthesis protein TonB
MNAPRTALLTTLLTGILLTSDGCFLQKKPKVVAPVVTPPAPSMPELPPAPAPEAVIPAPEPAAPVTAPAMPPSAPLPKPSPFPPAASVPKPAPVRPAPVQPVTPIPAPAPVPAPALGAILSTDERKQLDAAYQSDLRQANAVLNRLNSRTLTPDQADTANRARAFIQQATQYHDRDLTTAAELARRARVLTQDLAGAHK